MLQDAANRELLKILTRNDWVEILDLGQKKVFQRKFQIIEAFIELVGRYGLHTVVYKDIAQQCSVTRQLVEHHFPSRDQLIHFSYRYLYARLQRLAADSLIAQQGFFAQFRSYVKACAIWTREYPYDNQFLMQVYAIGKIHPVTHELVVRNSRIGNERLCALFKSGRKEGYLKAVPDKDLPYLSSSVQQLIIGYAIVAPSIEISRQKAAEQQLWHGCLALAGIEKREKSRF
jgi:AcrR family transcriptional regulator